MTEWINIEMVHSKDTRNKFVYTASTSEDRPDIPTLYIEKSAFPGGARPERIVVKVEAE